MTTATNAPQSTQTTARHGTCRLIPTGNLSLADALESGDAMLAIYPERGEAANYTVQRLADADGRTVGFRLTRLAWYIVDRKLYDIDVTPGFGWRCDCPDAQYRSHECKHVRSLRAALAQAGIDVPQPQRQEPAADPMEFDDP